MDCASPEQKSGGERPLPREAGFEARAVSPFREMGAYEALWSVVSATVCIGNRPSSSRNLSIASLRPPVVGDSIASVRFGLFAGGGEILR